MQPPVEPLPTCRPGPARCRGAGAVVFDLLPAVPGRPHDDAEIAAPDHVGECGPCRAALIACLRAECAGPIPVMAAWLDQIRAARFADGPDRLHEDARQEAMARAWVLLTTHAHFDPATTLADDGSPTGYLAATMRKVGLGLLKDERDRPSSLEEKLEHDPSGSFVVRSLAPYHPDEDPEIATLFVFGVRAVEAAIRTTLAGYTGARRRVVELWLEGLPEHSEALGQVEIGERVGYSQGNVSKIIKAFVAELRAWLEQQEDR